MSYVNTLSRFLITVCKVKILDPILNEHWENLPESDMHKLMYKKDPISYDPKAVRLALNWPKDNTSQQEGCRFEPASRLVLFL